MEKATMKSKKKILNFLPKVAQASVSFQSPSPYSPAAGRSRWPDFNVSKLRSKINKGVSGQIVSMIPVDARRNSKNLETLEPTSPKVSCMGQIKHRNNACKNKQVFSPKELDHMSSRPPPAPKKKPVPVIRKVFSVGRRSDASSHDQAKPTALDRAPRLTEMRRFASSRDTFANFDWTAARIAPEEDADFNSDEEGGCGDEEYDDLFPAPRPVLVSGSGAGLNLEPRKDINLWKRRTMAQPKPLQLNLIRPQ